MSWLARIRRERPWAGTGGYFQRVCEVYGLEEVKRLSTVAIRTEEERREGLSVNG